MQIDADTTQREIIETFKYAKGLISQPGKKKQQPINLDRDMQVLQLHQSGESNSDIAMWLTNEWPGNFNSDDVAKIIKRIISVNTKNRPKGRLR
jgi:hypothetical protein